MTQQETTSNDDSKGKFDLPGGESEDRSVESAIDCVDRLNRISYQRVLLRRLDGYFFKRSRT